MPGRRRRKGDNDNGFAAWGGYMEAKKAKLTEQYSKLAANQSDKKSDIFNNIAILVNGYTKPGADELKLLMAAHGGNYHLYQNQGGGLTTHIIATNLPNVKINQLGNVPVVSPEWITDSIRAEKLLDYKKYLLYTNHSRTQPKLNFAIIDKDKPIEEDKPIEYPQKYTKTAVDPQFLSEFYNNSRLHLISTLGAEFKQLVNKLRDESKGNFPGLERLNSIKDGNKAGSDLKSDSIIMHIDMDCFFVSVGLRNRPDLCGKPIAVTHSKTGRANPNGTNRQIEADLYVKRLPGGVIPKLNLIDDNSSMAEIASCSYEARKCGVHNGMFMGSALKLCPDLVPIPYDFQGYKDVSHILYRTIAEYTVDIEAVSCDEMYVDVTKILKKSNISVCEWASHIRHEIMERTGCPCSTGFGANRLQARLATKKAKPNGQYYLEPDDVENHMYQLPLKELPGVGYATIVKLNNLNLKTCGDLYDVNLSTLKTELGQRNSEIIYDQARGIDRKALNYEHERKSVSADVNYGIRFKNHGEAVVFLESLSVEVCNRLVDIKMKAKTITLKLLIRAEGAPKETAKYLGCGVCDGINKSVTTNYYMDNPQVIFKEAKSLYDRLNIVPEDLRGVGIQLSKLEKICLKPNKAMAMFLNRTSTITSNLVNDRNQENNLIVSSCIITNTKESVGKDLMKLNSKGGRSKRGNKDLKNNSNLTDYFKTGKNDTTVKETKNKMKNSIDLTVLKELPVELQREIMKEYDLSELDTDKIETTNSPEPSSISKDKITNRKLDNIQRRKGFGDLNKEELKMLLKNWIKNEDVPKDRDVDMLGAYFSSLVEDRKIEYLFSIVSLLYRHISMQNCKWHNAYCKLLNYFQERMLLIYGNTLLAPNGFSCGNHN